MKREWSKANLVPVHHPYPPSVREKSIPQNKQNSTKKVFEEEIGLEYVANKPVCVFVFVSSCWDKAATSASPSWVLNFQDGVSLLFSSFVPWFSTFAVSKYNSGSFSRCLIFPPAIEQRNMKKIHENDSIQTRRDRPVCKKKLGNYNKCEFSNFFLFQRPKMIISVLVACHDSGNLCVRFSLFF